MQETLQVLKQTRKQNILIKTLNHNINRGNIEPRGDFEPNN